MSILVSKFPKIIFLFFVSLSFLSISCSNRWLINHYTYSSLQVGTKDTLQSLAIKPIGSPYQELRKENGMDIIVNAQKMRSTKNFGETIQLLDQNQDIIYPGSIVAVNSNKGFIMKPLNDRNLPRSPLNIIIPTNGANASALVVKPDIRSINEEKAKLIQNIDLRKIVSVLEYSEAELNDYQSTMQELGLNADWLLASVETKFKKSKETRKNVLWVRFKQVYYSIVSEGYNEPASYFLHDSASVDAVDAFIKNISFQNPPCYVAQIDYGRTFLIQLSSSLSVDTMKTMLKGGFAAYSGELSTEFKRASHDIQTEIISVGGSPEDWADLQGSINFLEIRDKIQKVIRNGMNPNSPAAPVAMVLRHLSDRSPVCINSSVEYVRKDEYCGFVPKEYILDSIEVSVFPQKEGGQNWDPGVFDWFKADASYPDIYAKIGNNLSSELSDALHGWLRVNALIDLQQDNQFKIIFTDRDGIDANDPIGTVEFTAKDFQNGYGGKPVNILQPIELLNKKGQVYRVKIAMHPK